MVQKIDQKVSITLPARRNKTSLIINRPNKSYVILAPMKMYILIKESVPDSFAPVIAAHASLACYKKFETDTDMQQWIQGIFKKVVCKVSANEFDRAKSEDKNIVLTESALDNQEVCVAFCPREEYPKGFSFFKMWKPNN